MLKISDSELIKEDERILQILVNLINTKKYPLRTFIEDIDKVRDICMQDVEQFSQLKIKFEKLLTGAKIVGYHLLQGQSRLDSEILTRTAKKILSILQQKKGISSSDEFSQDVIDYFMNHQNDSDTWFLFESELNLEELRMFRYFKLQGIVNTFNRRHIPKLVIANYQNYEDFLSALFLLKQGNDFDNQQEDIIKSSVKIIPLIEDMEGFYKFSEDMKVLLSLKIIRNYFKKHTEFVFMIACSDTPRENGLVASNSAIITCLSEINDTFLKGTHLTEQELGELELINNPYGLLLGSNKPLQIFWDTVYNYTEIIAENPTEIVFKKQNNQLQEQK